MLDIRIVTPIFSPATCVAAMVNSAISECNRLTLDLHLHSNDSETVEVFRRLVQRRDD